MIYELRHFPRSQIESDRKADSNKSSTDAAVSFGKITGCFHSYIL